MAEQKQQQKSDNDKLAESREQARQAGAEKSAKASGLDEFREQLDSGYADLTKAQERHYKDQLDPERDENGIVVQTSLAGAAIAQEQSRRAHGQGEGGGAWPAELLARHLEPLPATRSVVGDYPEN